MVQESKRLWLHGLLEVCVLGLLEERRDYGLALANRLEDAGLGSVPGGTMYPALLRLETAGLVRSVREPSTTGPPRKYFEVTVEGRSVLAQRRHEWREFSRSIDAVLGLEAHT
ncbi:MAG TPA: PadR family transcriptional regulator [Microthrixaceae bacterium]|jgi:PadR family transcriptional regulator PadR|nr:PadR family transcriptional regulator [Rhodoglobus sp.]HQF94677.1 PadR family transcriptional regulator [Microthrixaceae bacterium]